MTCSGYTALTGLDSRPVEEAQGVWAQEGTPNPRLVRGSRQLGFLEEEGLCKMEVKGFQPSSCPGEASRFMVVTFCNGTFVHNAEVLCSQRLPHSGNTQNSLGKRMYYLALALAQGRDTVTI